MDILNFEFFDMFLDTQKGHWNLMIMFITTHALYLTFLQHFDIKVFISWSVNYDCHTRRLVKFCMIFQNACKNISLNMFKLYCVLKSLYYYILFQGIMNLVTCVGKYNYVSILLLLMTQKCSKPNKTLINDLQTLVDQYICEIISTICYTWKAMLSIWNCNTHCQKTTSNICCSTTQVLTMCSGMKEINFRIIPIHIYSVLCILKTFAKKWIFSGFLNTLLSNIDENVILFTVSIYVHKCHSISILFKYMD